MRVLALALLVGITLAPVASADPTSTTPPERPLDKTSVEFIDNPSIVDTHPIPVESWTRLEGGDVLALHFTTGSPECFGVHAVVHETTETVTVELRGGTLPEAVGRMCVMIAASGVLHTPLQSPLGDRQVVSMY